MTELSTLIDLDRHPISDAAYRTRCRATLESDGALNLARFIADAALAAIQAEAGALMPNAYFSPQKHNVYLAPPDPAFPPDHPPNREVLSSKGCVCDDEIAVNSPLRAL